MKVSEILTESDDASVLKLAQRVQKGSSLSSAKDLEAVLSKLPGWKIEKKVVAKRLHTFDLSSSIEDMFEPLHTGPTGGRQDLKVNIAADPEKEGAALNAVHEKLLKMEVKELPAKLKPDMLFIMNVSDLKPHREYTHIKYFDFDVLYTSRGYEITAPNGKTYPLGKVPRSSGLDTHRLHDWMTIETSFHDDLVDVFGDHSRQAKERERAEIKASTTENTGTCQICARTQKMLRGRMVNHGYNRPGYGYIVGNCFGVGHEAYEKSKDACETYIERLEVYLVNTERNLERLKTGKVKSFKIAAKRKGQEDRVITSDDAEWEDHLKRAINNEEHQKSQIESDIKFYKKRIADWKEVPYKWEKK